MKTLHRLRTAAYRTIVHLMIPTFVCFAAFVSHNAQAQNIEFETKNVEYKGLIAKLYLPKTAGKVPAVIAFGGSDPSWAHADANGEMMAKNGIAVIGAVYFKMDPSLPVSLDQIPMEYFIKAIDYAQTVPQIDANRIGVVSGSRGSEAGFLLAILDQRIKSVVITTPSKVAWGGMTSPKSAWTYQGKDIPSLSLPDLANATQLERFQLALADQEKVKKAMFSFERINGPVLLISAENDQIWPGTAMSNDIVVYLKQRNFAHSIIHKSYPTGHAFSRETAPEIKQMIIDHFIHTLKDR
jgi:pimeloyl-ACP methyl ester carboxylesterase